MKRIAYILILTLAPALFCTAQSLKDQERFDYVVKQMGLSKEVKSKLKPIFYAYRKDLKAAKKTYDDLKDKYATAIAKKKLTAEQATALLNAHWDSDAKEAQVRKEYTPKFGTVLSSPEVYYLFSYANDNKEKRESKSKK